MRHATLVSLLAILACSSPPVDPPSVTLPVGELRGRALVQDASGALVPAVNADIGLVGSRLSVRAGADGVFRFVELPQGRFELACSFDRDADGVPDDGRRVVVDLAPSLDLGDVVLGPFGGLRAFVTSGGTPIAGAAVAIASVAALPTDEQGLALFPGLTPGRYEVTAIVDEGMLVPRAVEVPPGKTIDVALEMANTMPSGTAQVRVAGPAQGATVRLVDDAAEVVLAEEVAIPGLFTNGTVPAGVYTAVARRPGAPAVTIAAVFPGATLPDLMLAPGDCVAIRAGACAAAGATCGAIDDGCGGEIDCGSCALPTVCGAANQCVCVPESDVVLCAAAGAQCGAIDDGCGGEVDCGSCTAPSTCGAANQCVCVPESDVVLCAAAGAECGALDDGCGGEVDCGSCTSPMTCGAVTANQCACVPESDEELCTVRGAACGSLVTQDRCGTERFIEGCGTACGDFDSCGGGGVANQCGCTPETDAELCDASQACGGTMNFTDVCGASREVTCGGCNGPATCGGGGTPNVCGCPVLSDAEFCAQIGWSCGDFADTWCGAFRTVNCGTCAAPESCGGAGVAHACGVSIDGWAFEHPALGSNPLFNVMVPSDERAWAVGAAGTLMRWESATGWTRVDAGTAARLTGVFALADDDVWVTSSRGPSGLGSLHHWDGVAWTRSMVDSVDYSGVWASGPDDVWAISSYGGAYGAWRYDGTAWTGVEVNLPGSPSLSSISGTGPDDVWVVGYGAQVSHLESGVFVDRSPGSPTLGHFNSVHARTSDDVWMGGTVPSLYRWDGAALSTVPRPTIYDVQSVWSDAPGGVIASQPNSVASPISRRVGTTWSNSAPLPGKVLSIHGHDATAFAVGTAGTIAQWGGGTTWTPAHVPLTTAQLKSVWLHGADEGWAVGATGTVLHLTGGVWQSVAVTPSTVSVNAVWGSAANDVWLVGAGGNLWHWDGSALTRTQLDASRELRAVWGTSATDVWVAGASALLKHFDGTTWSDVSTGVLPAPSLYVGVWGTSATDVWVATGNGLVTRWNGTAWTTVRPVAGWSVNALSGSSPEDVYLATANGLYRYDGATWKLDLGGSIVSVLATGGGEAWAFGGSSEALLRRRNPDGTWRVSWTGMDGTLMGIAAAGAEDVRIVGSDGAILRRLGP